MSRETEGCKMRGEAIGGKVKSKSGKVEKSRAKIKKGPLFNIIV